MAVSFLGKRIIVTGGTGFIGSVLVRRLLEQGAVVNLFVDAHDSCERIMDIIDHVTLIPISQWTEEVLAFHIEQCTPTHILHARGKIAPDPAQGVSDELFRINLMDTQILAKAACRFPIELFLFLGTIAEYGSCSAPFREDSDPAPISMYGESKLAATQWLLTPGTVTFPVSVIRLSLVYGPAQHRHAALIPTVIAHCLAKKDFYFSTPGIHTRDPLFVEDAVMGIVCALQSTLVHGEIINIGLGAEYAVHDIAERINRLCGTPIRIYVGDQPNRPGENDHYWLDIQKAERLIGWRPTTSLDKGLFETISWYRAQSKIF